MLPLVEQLAGITSLVWERVLSLPLESVPLPPDAAPAPLADGITGSIHIRGAWEGTITIGAPEGLVRRAAAIMFGLPDAEIGDAEIKDALGELTNMVGGSYKALLPVRCELSQPRVQAAAEAALRLVDNDVVEEVSFRSEGHLFAVTLLKRVRQ